MEGDSVSLLLQVEHAGQSRIGVRPLYWSAEGDSIPLLLPALLSSGRPVQWSAEGDNIPLLLPALFSSG